MTHFAQNILNDSPSDYGADNLTGILKSLAVGIRGDAVTRNVTRLPQVKDDIPATQEVDRGALISVDLEDTVSSHEQLMEMQGIFMIAGGTRSEVAIEGFTPMLGDSTVNRWQFGDVLTITPVVNEEEVQDYQDNYLPTFDNQVEGQSVPYPLISGNLGGTLTQTSTLGEPTDLTASTAYLSWVKYGECRDGFLELYTDGYVIYDVAGNAVASSGGTSSFFNATTTGGGFSRVFYGDDESAIYNDTTGDLLLLQDFTTINLVGVVSAFKYAGDWFFLTSIGDIYCYLYRSELTVTQSLAETGRDVRELGSDVLLVTDDSYYRFNFPFRRFDKIGDVTASGTPAALVGVQGSACLIVLDGVNAKLIRLWDNIQLASTPETTIAAIPFNVICSNRGLTVSVIQGSFKRRYQLAVKDTRDNVLNTETTTTIYDLTSDSHLSSVLGGIEVQVRDSPVASSNTNLDASDTYVLDLRVIRARDDAPAFTPLVTARQASLAANEWQVFYEGGLYTYTANSSQEMIHAVVVRNDSLYGLLRLYTSQDVSTDGAGKSYFFTESLVKLTYAGVNGTNLHNVALTSSVPQNFQTVFGPYGDNLSIVPQNNFRFDKDFQGRFYRGGLTPSPVANNIDWFVDAWHFNTKLYTNWDSPVLFTTPNCMLVAKPIVTLDSVEKNLGIEGDSFSYTTPAASPLNDGAEGTVTTDPPILVQTRPVKVTKDVEMFTTGEVVFIPPSCTPIFVTSFTSDDGQDPQGNNIKFDLPGWEANNPGFSTSNVGASMGTDFVQFGGYGSQPNAPGLSSRASAVFIETPLFYYEPQNQGALDMSTMNFSFSWAYTTGLIPSVGSTNIYFGIRQGDTIYRFATPMHPGQAESAGLGNPAQVYGTNSSVNGVTSNFVQDTTGFNVATNWYQVIEDIRNQGTGKIWEEDTGSNPNFNSGSRITFGVVFDHRRGSGSATQNNVIHQFTFDSLNIETTGTQLKQGAMLDIGTTTPTPPPLFSDLGSGTVTYSTGVSGSIMNGAQPNINVGDFQFVQDGEEVTLTAVPSNTNNSTFVEWGAGSPCAGSTDAVCTFCVSGNATTGVQSFNAVFTGDIVFGGGIT